MAAMTRLKNFLAYFAVMFAASCAAIPAPALAQLQTPDQVATSVAKRTSPLLRTQSLGAGPMTNGPILLQNDFTAVHEYAQTTNVGHQPTAGFGGGFTQYIQHRIVGQAGEKGYAGGGIRVQVEALFSNKPGGFTNDPVAGYFTVFNGGRSLGAFALHVDSYHEGRADAGPHTTYGMSAESYKRIPEGVAANYVGRSMGTHPLDYGMIFLSSWTNAGYKTGIQFGSQAYEQGGIPGMSPTHFNIGIDMTQATFGRAAIRMKHDDWIEFSEWSRMRWNSQTGNLELRFGDAMRFGVNVSNGQLFLAEKALDDKGRLKVMFEDDQGKMRPGFIKVEFQ
jgi:hypothetical protein